MTDIEWTDETRNFLRGCRKKSTGCDACYALVASWIRVNNPLTAAKFAGVVEKKTGGSLHWTGRVNFDRDTLHSMLKIRTPRLLFPNSMSDLFFIPAVREEWIAEALAVFSLVPHVMFQPLTKRPEVANELLNDPVFVKEIERFRLELSPDAGPLPWPIPNVWLGTSVENQKYADERISLLLGTPAAVRYLSCEPLVGPVDLSEHLVEHRAVTHPYYDAPDGAVVDGMERIGDEWVRVERIHQVITGGESGSGARPAPHAWFRTLRDQCTEAGVAYFHKQHGEWTDGPRPQGSRHRQALVDVRTGEIVTEGGDVSPSDPHQVVMHRAGKKTAGRLLDGRLHEDFPAGWSRGGDRP